MEGVMERNQADVAARLILNRDEVLEKRKGYWRLRRFQDVFLSLLALAVLWPIMFLIALVVWIDSPGASPIFVQKRVGRDGKEFNFYKFRSMVPDAESKLETVLSLNESNGPAFKIKDDPRITHVGKLLRRTSLDELPQLYNILKGDMSIVGPRPPLPREVARYDSYDMQRLYVTPGLTCYWQVHPNRYQMSFEEWVRLDIQYINDSCFRKDWQIILQTFGAVLRLNGE